MHPHGYHGVEVVCSNQQHRHGFRHESASCVFCSYTVHELMPHIYHKTRGAALTHD